MRDYNNELMEYEQDAEDRYDDYNYEDEFESGFEGLEDEYYDEDYEEDMEHIPTEEYPDGQYDGYSMSSVGRIDPNDRTLTIVVKNTSGETAEAILFGGNEEAAQPAGVTVTVEESSHKEVREESKSNPFRVSGMKMSVSNSLQFDNVMKINKRTATGSNTVRVYQPRNASSPQNHSQLLIDDGNFEMNVTGQDSLRLMVNEGTTIVLTLTINARANMGNLLRGGNVAEVSHTPRTTGLPQIDLLRNRRPKPYGLKPGRRVRKLTGRRPVRRMGKPQDRLLVRKHRYA